jgi:hypothetical protein
MLYVAVFAVGCVLALAGCVALVSGWVPAWRQPVLRPRLLGLWGLCWGVFCMVQLPALRDRVADTGTVGIDAVLLLVVVALVTLFLSGRSRRTR